MGKNSKITTNCYKTCQEDGFLQFGHGVRRVWGYFSDIEGRCADQVGISMTGSDGKGWEAEIWRFM